MGTKRKSFTAKEKLQIVEKAIRLGNNIMVSRMHDIDDKCIRNWKKDIDNLKKINNSINLINLSPKIHGHRS